jgi:hypothetical protein
MFKNSYSENNLEGGPAPLLDRARPLAQSLLVLLLFGLTSCQTALPLPKMNLAESGWTTRQGQAVWCPGRDAPEIAGDLILATNPDGRAFVHFSKSPVTLAVAEKTVNTWQVEFPAWNRRYAGRGKPPGRLVWLILAGAVSGTPPPKPWSWQQLEDGNWRLDNPVTGESLAGCFTS